MLLSVIIGCDLVGINTCHASQKKQNPKFTYEYFNSYTGNLLYLK